MPAYVDSFTLHEPGRYDQVIVFKVLVLSMARSVFVVVFSQMSPGRNAPALNAAVSSVVVINAAVNRFEVSSFNTRMSRALNND
jgi:hypothetical protein